MYWHLIIPWCYFLSVARINSSSIFGRRVLFLAAKTGTPFHFFLLKVEWGAVFGPFRFWHDRTLPVAENFRIKNREPVSQEIMSPGNSVAATGFNVAPAKHVFPTPGNFVAVCVARIYCLLNMQVPMRTAT